MFNQTIGLLLLSPLALFVLAKAFQYCGVYKPEAALGLALFILMALWGLSFLI